jgi:resolvase-like protein
VVREFEDPGYLGKFLERPDPDELRDLVTTGGLGLVVVSKRDRLARGVYAAYLKNEFKRRGVELVAPGHPETRGAQPRLTRCWTSQFPPARTANSSPGGLSAGTLVEITNLYFDGVLYLEHRGVGPKTQNYLSYAPVPY